MKDISEYSDSDLESIIIINKIYRKCLLKKSIGMMDEIGLRWKNSLSETDHVTTPVMALSCEGLPAGWL